jgi:hypothetical protein
VEVFNCDSEPRELILELSVYGENFKGMVFEGYRPELVTSRTIGMGDSWTEAKLRSSGTLDSGVHLNAGQGHNLYKISLQMGDFRWWSPESPWLYQRH